MKYTSLAAFEKHVEDAAPQHLADIYMILSKESYPRQHAVNKLTSLALKSEASQEFSVTTYDATKDSVADILSDLNTLSFFSSRRVLVILNADAFNREATLKLEKYFTNPSRSVCLIVVAEAINRGTTFYKNAEKAGIILDISEEKPWEKEKNIADWIVLHTKQLGKQINLPIAQQLVKQLGTDQMLLNNELQKLVCYVGDRKAITEKDISDICIHLNLETAWQLGESIFRRDAASALRITKGLLDDGTALIALLRQIRYQFQTEFQVCSILTTGGTPGDVAREFPYMKGQILDRHVQTAQSYGMQRFKNGILAIDAAELSAKNSALDSSLLAEMLIIKLTQ